MICVVIAMQKQPLFPVEQGRPHPSDQVLDRAMLALRMQRPEEAEQLAAGVLKASRGNVRAAVIHGQALMAQGRAEDAVVSLEKSARRTDDPTAATVLASALAAAGRAEESVSRLRQVTTRRPPFPPAFRELARQLDLVGRTSEALATLEAGLELAPDLVDLRADLGFICLKSHDRAGARAAFVQALEQAPGRGDICGALARAILADGDCTAAAEVFRRALALQPDDAALRADFGHCLLEIGERDAGEEALRMAANQPAMVGRVIMTLAASSHGRFFMRPSRASKFLHART